MTTIAVENFAQIKSAKIETGDITLLVGPQASGKSIFLQLFKLIHDATDITKTIKRYGYDWRSQNDNFLELYFGEGMGSLWPKNSCVKLDDNIISLDDLITSGKGGNESTFFIPAQRVLTLEKGWPKPFTSFDVGDPYVVKNFSEQLRRLMEAGLGGTEGTIFPKQGKMKKPLRDKLDTSIFHGAEVQLDATQLRRRIVISVNGNQLPFMTWSAGQREFMPLLLGLYWLMPSTAAAKKAGINWVVIEEPEMGLHPQAITSLVLTVLELVHRGYKILISTHSPLFLEVLWALRIFQESNADSDYLFNLFDVEKNNQLKDLFSNLMKKSFRTYYFNHLNNGVSVKDISSLDANSSDPLISDWGGITSFSTRAAEIISKVIGDTQCDLDLL